MHNIKIVIESPLEVRITEDHNSTIYSDVCTRVSVDLISELNWYMMYSRFIASHHLYVVKFLLLVLANDK